MHTMRVVEDTTAPARDSIGQPVLELQELASFGISAAPTLCISEETLKEIVEANNLTAKLESVWRKSSPNKPSEHEFIDTKVAHVFSKVKIPKHISQSILKHYHKMFGKHFVAVYSTNHGIDHPKLCHENVKGDANVLHSALQVWQLLVTEYLKQSAPEFDPEWITPSSLMIQTQYEAQASGVAYTKHPLTNDLTQVVIRSVHGVQSLKDRYEKTDTFTVDIRTWSIVTTRKSTQTLEYLRKPDSYTASGLTVKRQNELSLEAEKVVELARLTHAIKQHFPNHKKVWWSLVDGEFIISRIKTFHVDTQVKSQVSTSTRTQILLDVATPDKTTELSQTAMTNSDGIGQLSSDHLLTHLGAHPMHLIRGKHVDSYKQTILEHITQFLNTHNDPFCMYRSLQLTSTQLKKLRHATTYEPDEDNPMLGFRGGSRVLLHPEIFKFELDIIREVLKQTRSTVGLAVPYVRSPQELALIVDKVTKSGLPEIGNFQLWWQISTPENILNLEQYNLESVAGVIIDCTALHSLLVGVDRDNEELAAHYPLNVAGMKKLIQTAMGQLKTKQLDSLQMQKMLVYLSQYDSQLLRIAVELHSDGVILKPEVAEQAKASIKEVESQLLQTQKKEEPLPA